MIDVIVDAICLGLAKSAGSVAAQAALDAYSVVRGLLLAKFGQASPVNNALDRLESKPESAERKAVLAGEFVAAKVDKDLELRHAIDVLKAEIIKLKSEKLSNRQSASGTNISQANNNSSASVSVTYGTDVNKS